MVWRRQEPLPAGEGDKLRAPSESCGLIDWIYH